MWCSGPTTHNPTHMQATLQAHPPHDDDYVQRLLGCAGMGGPQRSRSELAAGSRCFSAAMVLRFVPPRHVRKPIRTRARHCLLLLLIYRHDRFYYLTAPRTGQACCIARGHRHVIGVTRLAIIDSTTFRLICRRPSRQLLAPSGRCTGLGPDLDTPVSPPRAHG